jgi:hypothetical protein
MGKRNIFFSTIVIYFSWQFSNPSKDLIAAEVVSELLTQALDLTMLVK